VSGSSPVPPWRRWVAAAAAVSAALAPLLVVPAATASSPPTRVIVATDGTAAHERAAEQAVTAAGGQVGRRLGLVGGFAASVPAAALPALSAGPGVLSVTPDAAGHLMAVDPVLGFDPVADEGAPTFIGAVVGVRPAWTAGITGKGVDVALIDSGVTKVKGLSSGNVVDGPDLSFDSQDPTTRYLDGYGHGTHLASIIAGRDAAGTAASYAASGWVGVAPDARVISVKVADGGGAADVSQVIAAIDWITQHAHDNGLNIRVLNLSYGTDSGQSYLLDPLAYAAEQAWKRGIVVVAAAGNDGTLRADLADPASDPYVLAVGADDPMNTTDVKDDIVPPFAQRGTAGRHVDVIAPGVHVLGLRSPGSVVDVTNPAGRVGTRFIRGSGTSQATAVVSGIAALVLQKYPTATPDQVKYLIDISARRSTATKELWQGLGIVDAGKALSTKPSTAGVQAFAPATGRGTLEGARGTGHLTAGALALTGERDIFNRTWNATSWSTAVAANSAWTGGTFNGTAWTGSTWATPVSWSNTTWAGATWFGGSWSSRTWVGASWSSRTWVGAAWSGAAWS
jgi:serine protease AprX